MLNVTEFPRTPSGHLKRNITDEADARLAFYLKPDEPPPPGVEVPPRPQLPEGVVDAPLVRVFNFLRKYANELVNVCQLILSFFQEMMSLSYQLEILWYQVCEFALLAGVLS